MGEYPMSKILALSLLAVATVFAAAGSAMAQNAYFGVQGGFNFTHDGEFNNTGLDATFNRGYAYGAMFGYHTRGPIRLEGELTYRGNTIDTVGGVPATDKLSSTSLMANAYYDFTTGGSWTPYVGGGLGVSRVNFQSNADVRDIVLAYQLILGLAYNVTQNTVVALDYRYFGVDTPTFEAATNFDLEYTNSTFMFGVRAMF
jgi:opacity protein-like surface antigen